MTETRGLRRNIDRYSWYLFFRDCHFWGPAFFLYFTSVLNLSQALHLEAVYYVGVALLEVPSGYFSDRFGRKRTLMISSACLAGAYLLFFSGSSFLQFAVAQVFLAAGFSFASGTDTALHFESLKKLGRENEFTAREARGFRFAFIAGGISALIGGFSAFFGLKWIYGLSFGAAVILLVITSTLTEPVESKAGRTTESMGHQVADLFKKAWSHRFRFFTLYTLSLTIMLHIPYEFYQPYIAKAGSSFGWADKFTPPVAGIHLAVTMLIGAAFTSIAEKIKHRCVKRKVLLLSMFFQVILIGLMAVIVHPVIALILAGRTGAKAVAGPLVNAEVSPLLKQSERSTYLSIQSLLGRLCYSGILMVLPIGAILFEHPFQGTMATALFIGACLFASLCLIPFPRDPDLPCCGHEHKRFSFNFFTKNSS